MKIQTHNINTEQEKQRAFFNCLFGKTDGFIELRPKVDTKHGKVETQACRWFTLPQLISKYQAFNQWCKTNRCAGFFGVLPRTVVGGRKKEHVDSGCAVWLDVDTKDFLSETDMQNTVDALKPPPSCIVRSGGGLHLYWFLNADTPADTIVTANRAVAKMCGGDIAPTHKAGSLRLPGSWHQKDANNPVCLQFVKFSEKTHKIDALLKAWAAHVDQQKLPTGKRPTIKPKAGLSANVQALIDNNERINQLWHGIGKTDGDCTGSGYDASFTYQLLKWGVSVTDAANALAKRCQLEGRKKPRQYITHTVHNAAFKLSTNGQPKRTNTQANVGALLQCYPDNYKPAYKANQPKKTLRNLITILEKDPEFCGKVKLNAFKGRFEIGADALADQHITGIRLYVSDTYDLQYTADMVRDAVRYVAQQNSYHPVRDYLRGCATKYPVSRVYDITPDNWLHKICGAEDTPINAKMGRCFLLSAAQRQFKPGCEVHSSLILVGAQGVGKSSTFKVLARRKEWFRDSAIDLRGGGGRDAYSLLRGVFIYEFPELNAVLRVKNDEAIKAFLSSPVDTYRAAYAHFDEEHPRQCVFAMSINLQEFLRDFENRRFHPVEGGDVDLELLETVADSLWAQAVHLIDKGERWWFNSEENQDLKKAQIKFQAADTWMDAARQFAKDATATNGVTLKVALECAIGVDAKNQHKGMQMRFATAMQGAGWRKKRAHNGLWLWYPPNDDLTETINAIFVTSDPISLAEVVQLTGTEDTHANRLEVAGILSKLGFTKKRVTQNGHRVWLWYPPR